jgi:hypothetical protein
MIRSPSVRGNCGPGAFATCETTPTDPRVLMHRSWSLSRSPDGSHDRDG